jgi:hypothetical protein
MEKSSKIKNSNLKLFNAISFFYDYFSAAKLCTGGTTEAPQRKSDTKFAHGTNASILFVLSFLVISLFVNAFVY